MADKFLVIVESPAKAKSIKKYLGASYDVKASVGHVIDLPKSTLGVDVEGGSFEPTYEILRGKKKVITELVNSAKKASKIFLATDPDREGEAIAWHIAEEIKRGIKPLKGANKAPQAPIKRILFHEITPKAVKEALKNPGEIDKRLFDSQQARRILDRLVGYKISPLLWEKVRRGLSAGRVQSVAVRIICEREEEIKTFNQEEYWSIVAKLLGSAKPEFESKLAKIDGKKAEIGKDADANKIVKELEGEDFILSKITRQQRKRNPTPPFITSTLQQEASRKLGFAAKRTMDAAQKLYEGVELADGDTVGLITYMRTDSTRVSNEAIDAVRTYIGSQFGKEFLPEKPNEYKVKRSAQEAHEAIRPTSMELPPEAVVDLLMKDQFRLYELIWKKFVASQMVPAQFDQTAFDIKAGKYDFRSTGNIMTFPGFIAAYMEDIDDAGEKDEEENSTLPELREGEKLDLKKIIPNQHFTQPPPRYTEASLVKALEEKGIGRPSTYAAILSTIQDKEYAEKDEKRFKPTRLGEIVNELLVGSFPNILDVGFTAKMEDELDAIEDGKRGWVEVLNDFYKPFSETLEKAKVKMKDIKRQEIETVFKCEECASVMVIKWGRRGEFLACSNYPKCKNTKEFRMDETGNLQIVLPKVSTEICPTCGSALTVRHGRFGEFLACTGYPNCKFTKAISVGVRCPDCDGDIVQKRTRRGKYFYGCGNYPKCEFALWSKPVAEKCPQCGSPYLIEKLSKKAGDYIACPDKECGYKRPLVEAK